MSCAPLNSRVWMTFFNQRYLCPQLSNCCVCDLPKPPDCYASPLQTPASCAIDLCSILRRPPSSFIPCECQHLDPTHRLFNRYEPTYECQHLDPTRRFLHRSWVLHIDPAQTMYAQSKLAYLVRQVESSKQCQANSSRQEDKMTRSFSIKKKG